MVVRRIKIWKRRGGLKSLFPWRFSRIANLIPSHSSLATSPQSLISLFLRSCRRQKYLFIDQAVFSRIIMLYAIIVVEHSGTALISRGGDGGPSAASTHDFCFQMVNCHTRSPSSIVPSSLVLSQPRPP